MLHPSIQAQLPLVTKLFRESNIKDAYAFGSAVSENFNAESDIDLLINFQEGVDPLEKGKLWWSLHDNLRDIFKRDVDLLIENSLKNPYLIEEINEKKQLIYST